MPRTIQVSKKKEFTHSPTLNTVLMVEDLLREKRDLMTLAELKRCLPKQVMHNTLLQILDYLQHSGKIIIGTKGILWIYAERKELDELKKRGTEV
jgi:hypothetical protein